MTTAMVRSSPRLVRAAELFTDELTPPRCAHCDRPVDFFKVKHEAFFQRVVVEIRCHGAADYVQLDEEQLVDPSIGEVFGADHAPRWGGAKEPA